VPIATSRYDTPPHHFVLTDLLLQHVDTFVYEMGRQEQDLSKRAKIDFLQLTSAEWTRVGQFTDLLSYADVAQQAFSSEQGSTLHLAIPALETLHKSWSSRAERQKYIRFADPLKAAAKKLDEYYEKTTDTAAYVIAMCSSFLFSSSRL